MPATGPRPWWRATAACCSPARVPATSRDWCASRPTRCASRGPASRSRTSSAPPAVPGWCSPTRPEPRRPACRSGSTRVRRSAGSTTPRSRSSAAGGCRRWTAAAGWTRCPTPPSTPPTTPSSCRPAAGTCTCAPRPVVSGGSSTCRPTRRIRSPAAPAMRPSAPTARPSRGSTPPVPHRCSISRRALAVRCSACRFPRYPATSSAISGSRRTGTTSCTRRPGPTTMRSCAWRCCRTGTPSRCPTAPPAGRRTGPPRDGCSPCGAVATSTRYRWIRPPTGRRPCRGWRWRSPTRRSAGTRAPSGRSPHRTRHCRHCRASPGRRCCGCCRSRGVRPTPGCGSPSTRPRTCRSRGRPRRRSCSARGLTVPSPCAPRTSRTSSPRRPRHRSSAAIPPRCPVRYC